MDSKTALQNFHACIQNAPEGLYEDAKALGAVIDESCTNLMRDVRALGLKADTCDLIFAVEAAIYNYVALSNPESGLFPTAEGFGASMQTEARERVLVINAAWQPLSESEIRARTER